MFTKKVLAIILALMLLTPVAALAAGEDPSTGLSNTIQTTGVIGSQTGGLPEVRGTWNAPDDSDPTHLESGIQVAIVPAGERNVTNYMVVTDPNGRADINDVFVDVYHPDGSFKLQSHGEKVTSDTEIAAALAEAVATGELTAAESAALADEIGNLQTAYMYKTVFPMNSCQYHGIYKVEARAVDKVGGMSLVTPISTCTFEWVMTKVLARDFSSVDYGAITLGSEKVVPGNFVMESGQNSATPTIHNQGNVDLAITLNFSPMVRSEAPVKTITHFDAKLHVPNADGSITGIGESIDPITAGTPVTFTTPLIPCHPSKLNFSVHADTQPSGTYSGSVLLTAF